MLSQTTQFLGIVCRTCTIRYTAEETVSTLVAIDLDGLRIGATSCQGLSYVRGYSCCKIYVENGHDQGHVQVR